MPPRKRKVPEKVPETVNEEVVEENPVETPKENPDKPERKKRGRKKQKSTTVAVETSSGAEKHVVLKILFNAQTNEAFHSKYIKELTNQYVKVSENDFIYSMGMNLVARTYITVFWIFNFCQQIGHDAFLAKFICCLKQLIDKEESNAEYANVGLQFMAKFAASLTKDKSEDMHKFLEDVFDWVLQVSYIQHQKCSIFLVTSVFDWTNFSI